MNNTSVVRKQKGRSPKMATAHNFSLFDPCVLEGMSDQARESILMIKQFNH